MPSLAALLTWILVLTPWPGQNVQAMEIDEPTITVHQSVEMAVQRWFEPEQWDTFMCIIGTESTFNPFAVGKAGEVGLGQTHPIHRRAYDWPRLLSGDIDYQVGVLRDQYRWSGLRPWAAQKGKCW